MAKRNDKKTYSVYRNGKLAFATDVWEEARDAFRQIANDGDNAWSCKTGSFVPA